MYGPVLVHCSIREDDVRVPLAAVAQDNAIFCSAVQRPGLLALGALDRQMDQHSFSEWHEALDECALSHPLVGCEAILPLDADVDDESRILDQPGEQRALQRDLQIDLLL